MNILLCNDDGFYAQGMRALYDGLKDHHTLTIAAPEVEQSGVGHSFTYRKPVKCKTADFLPGIPGYIVSGTPADCVKLSIGHLMKTPPDLVVSGINNGDNSGIAGFYSGTVAAAREGAFWGIPSIAFSIADHHGRFFEEWSPCINDLTMRLAAAISESNAFGHAVYYNVNFPGCRRDECAGTLITRQSLAFYRDVYTETILEDGAIEYHLRGEKFNVEASNDYDSRAIENRYITITPHHFDTTDFTVIKALSNFSLSGHKEVI